MMLACAIGVIESDGHARRSAVPPFAGPLQCCQPLARWSGRKFTPRRTLKRPKRFTAASTWRLVGAAVFLGATLAAQAQVQSLTLAIQVNSPYGIGEPWATIRDGLQRLEFVESISQQPDHKASTGEMRTRQGRLPDLDTLAQALRDTGAGASLLGVEASIDGELAAEGDHFILRLPGSTTVLRLAPLT